MNGGTPDPPEQSSWVVEEAVDSKRDDDDDDDDDIDPHHDIPRYGNRDDDDDDDDSDYEEYSVYEEELIDDNEGEEEEEEEKADPPPATSGRETSVQSADFSTEPFSVDWADDVLLSNNSRRSIRGPSSGPPPRQEEGEVNRVGPHEEPTTTAPLPPQNDGVDDPPAPKASISAQNLDTDAINENIASMSRQREEEERHPQSQEELYFHTPDGTPTKSEDEEEPQGNVSPDWSFDAWNADPAEQGEEVQLIKQTEPEETKDQNDNIGQRRRTRTAHSSSMLSADTALQDNLSSSPKREFNSTDPVFRVGPPIDPSDNNIACASVKEDDDDDRNDNDAVLVMGSNHALSPQPVKYMRRRASKRTKPAMAPIDHDKPLEPSPQNPVRRPHKSRPQIAIPPSDLGPDEVPFHDDGSVSSLSENTESIISGHPWLPTTTSLTSPFAKRNDQQDNDKPELPHKSKANYSDDSSSSVESDNDNTKNRSEKENDHKQGGWDTIQIADITNDNKSSPGKDTTDSESDEATHEYEYTVERKKAPYTNLGSIAPPSEDNGSAVSRRSQPKLRHYFFKYYSFECCWWVSFACIIISVLAVLLVYFLFVHSSGEDAGLTVPPGETYQPTTVTPSLAPSIQLRRTALPTAVRTGAWDTESPTLLPTASPVNDDSNPLPTVERETLPPTWSDPFAIIVPSSTGPPLVRNAPTSTPTALVVEEGVPTSMPTAVAFDEDEETGSPVSQGSTVEPTSSPSDSTDDAFAMPSSLPTWSDPYAVIERPSLLEPPIVIRPSALTSTSPSTSPTTSSSPISIPDLLPSVTPTTMPSFSPPTSLPTANIMPSVRPTHMPSLAPFKNELEPTVLPPTGVESSTPSLAAPVVDTSTEAPSPWWIILAPTREPTEAPTRSPWWIVLAPTRNPTGDDGNLLREVEPLVLGRTAPSTITGGWTRNPLDDCWGNDESLLQRLNCHKRLLTSSNRKSQTEQGNS